MRGFAYLASLNLVGLSDPCWKWASCRLCMIRDEADCEGEEYWVRRLLGIGGRGGEEHTTNPNDLYSPSRRT